MFSLQNSDSNNTSLDSKTFDLKTVSNFSPQKHTFADIFRERFKRGSFFWQSFHLTAHVQSEFQSIITFCSSKGIAQLYYYIYILFDHTEL